MENKANQKISYHNSREFRLAVDIVLKHEGYYSNDADDRGGATKYGISLKFLQGLKDSDNDGYLDGDLNFDGIVDINDIRSLSPQDAVDLYYFEFWVKDQFDRLPYFLSPKLFDLAVNMGTQQANKLVQRAIKACGLPLDDDGIIGPRTLQALKLVDKSAVLSALRSEAAGFYRYLVASGKGHSKYLNGWLNRAYS